MSRVLTVRDVEAFDADGNGGHRQLVVGDGTLVTPLARDRAAALGVEIVSGNGHRSAPVVGPGRGEPPAAASPVSGDRLARLRAESVVRSVARQVLLRQGLGLGRLEDVVASVMERLSKPATACGCAGGQKCR